MTNVNNTTSHYTNQAADFIRYQNKLAEVKRIEERLRLEQKHLQQIQSNDPNKGLKVDITV